MNKRHVVFGFVLGLAALACIAATGGFFSDYLRVRKALAVGTYATANGRVSSQSDGTGDMYSGLTSSAVETFKVDKDGDLTAIQGTFSGAVGLTSTLAVDGNVTLGNAVTDQHTVNGRLASSYFQSVTDASAYTYQHMGSFTGKLTGDTPFSTKSQMEGGFFAIQIDATGDSQTDKILIGAEGKATCDQDFTGSSKIIGLLGKAYQRTSGKTGAAAYGVQSDVYTNSGATITAASNFHADLSNSGTITTSNVLDCEADTWTNGINLDSGTFTTDIILQNAETIDNATNGTVKVTGALESTSTLTAGGAFHPKGVTADPCAGAGYGEGAVFWNSTSHYLCYCNESSVDLKVVDNTTACF